MRQINAFWREEQADERRRRRQHVVDTNQAYAGGKGAQKHIEQLED